MELKGKKVNFLGDSITEGCGTSGLAFCFTELLREREGLAESRNYGIGGTRIARQQSLNLDDKFDQDYCARARTMDPDADLVVVFGGTNDYGHGDAPMGTPADTTPDTFWGALHTLYTTLQARYPGKPVVVLTPLHRSIEDNPLGDPPVKPVPGSLLPEYVAAIRTRAAEFGLPVLDLYETSFITPADPVILEGYIPDGLHPNDRGHQVLTEEISRFLHSL